MGPTKKVSELNDSNDGDYVRFVEYFATVGLEEGPDKQLRFLEDDDVTAGALQGSWEDAITDVTVVLEGKEACPEGYELIQRSCSGKLKGDLNHGTISPTILLAYRRQRVAQCSTYIVDMKVVVGKDLGMDHWKDNQGGWRIMTAAGGKPADVNKNGVGGMYIALRVLERDLLDCPPPIHDICVIVPGKDEAERCPPGYVQLAENLNMERTFGDEVYIGYLLGPGVSACSLPLRGKVSQRHPGSISGYGEGDNKKMMDFRSSPFPQEQLPMFVFPEGAFLKYVRGTKEVEVGPPSEEAGTAADQPVQLQQPQQPISLRRSNSAPPAEETLVVYPPEPSFFTFIFTNIDGRHNYAACLVFYEQLSSEAVQSFVASTKEIVQRSRSRQEAGEEEQTEEVGEDRAPALHAGFTRVGSPSHKKLVEDLAQLGDFHEEDDLYAKQRQVAEGDNPDQDAGSPNDTFSSASVSPLPVDRGPAAAAAVIAAPPQPAFDKRVADGLMVGAVFAPKAICIITRVPVYRSMRQLLHHLYDTAQASSREGSSKGSTLLLGSSSLPGRLALSSQPLPVLGSGSGSVTGSSGISSNGGSGGGDGGGSTALVSSSTAQPAAAVRIGALLGLVSCVPMPLPGGRSFQVQLTPKRDKDTRSPYIHLKVPPSVWLPHTEVDFFSVFHCLSVQHVIAAFTLMLNEERLLFLSSNEEVLTAAMEALQNLLFPLEWQSLYVPRLPKALYGCLEAPGGFMLGIPLQPQQMGRNTHEALKILQLEGIAHVINLDTDEVVLDTGVPYSEACAAERKRQARLHRRQASWAKGPGNVLDSLHGSSDDGEQWSSHGGGGGGSTNSSLHVGDKNATCTVDFMPEAMEKELTMKLEDIIQSIDFDIGMFEDMTGGISRSGSSGEGGITGGSGSADNRGGPGAAGGGGGGGGGGSGAAGTGYNTANVLSSPRASFSLPASRTGSPRRRPSLTTRGSGTVTPIPKRTGGLGGLFSQTSSRKIMGGVGVMGNKTLGPQGTPGNDKKGGAATPPPNWQTSANATPFVRATMAAVAAEATVRAGTAPSNPSALALAVKQALGMTQEGGDALAGGRPSRRTTSVEEFEEEVRDAFLCATAEMLGDIGSFVLPKQLTKTAGGGGKGAAAYRPLPLSQLFSEEAFLERCNGDPVMRAFMGRLTCSQMFWMLVQNWVEGSEMAGRLVFFEECVKVWKQRRRSVLGLGRREGSDKIPDKSVAATVVGGMVGGVVGGLTAMSLGVGGGGGGGGGGAAGAGGKRMSTQLPNGSVTTGSTGTKVLGGGVANAGAAGGAGSVSTWQAMARLPPIISEVRAHSRVVSASSIKERPSKPPVRRSGSVDAGGLDSTDDEDDDDDDDRDDAEDDAENDVAQGVDFGDNDDPNDRRGLAQTQRAASDGSSSSGRKSLSRKASGGGGGGGGTFGFKRTLAFYDESRNSTPSETVSAQVGQLQTETSRKGGLGSNDSKSSSASKMADELRLREENALPLVIPLTIPEILLEAGVDAAKGSGSNTRVSGMTASDDGFDENDGEGGRADGASHALTDSAAVDSTVGGLWPDELKALNEPLSEQPLVLRQLLAHAAEWHSLYYASATAGLSGGPGGRRLHDDQFVSGLTRGLRDSAASKDLDNVDEALRVYVSAHAVFLLCLPTTVARDLGGGAMPHMMAALGVVKHLQAVGAGSLLDEMMWRYLLVAAGRIGGDLMRLVAAAIFEAMRDENIAPNSVTYGLYTKALGEHVEVVTKKSPYGSSSSSSSSSAGAGSGYRGASSVYSMTGSCYCSNRYGLFEELGLQWCQTALGQSSAASAVERAVGTRRTSTSDYGIGGGTIGGTGASSAGGSGTSLGLVGPGLPHTPKRVAAGGLGRAASSRINVSNIDGGMVATAAGGGGGGGGGPPQGSHGVTPPRRKSEHNVSMTDKPGWNQLRVDTTLTTLQAVEEEDPRIALSSSSSSGFYRSPSRSSANGNAGPAIAASGKIANASSAGGANPSLAPSLSNASYSGTFGGVLNPVRRQGRGYGCGVHRRRVGAVGMWCASRCPNDVCMYDVLEEEVMAKWTHEFDNEKHFKISCPRCETSFFPELCYVVFKPSEDHVMQHMPDKGDEPASSRSPATQTPTSAHTPTAFWRQPVSRPQQAAMQTPTRATTTATREDDSSTLSRLQVDGGGGEDGEGGAGSNGGSKEVHEGKGGDGAAGNGGEAAEGGGCAGNDGGGDGDDDKMMTGPVGSISGVLPDQFEGKVIYLSPVVLRHQLERLVVTHGEEVLTVEGIRRYHRHLYWNMVWMTGRLSLPMPLQQGENFEVDETVVTTGSAAVAMARCQLLMAMQNIDYSGLVPSFGRPYAFTVFTSPSLQRAILPPPPLEAVFSGATPREMKVCALCLSALLAHGTAGMGAVISRLLRFAKNNYKGGSLGSGAILSTGDSMYSVLLKLVAYYRLPRGPSSVATVPELKAARQPSFEQAYVDDLLRLLESEAALDQQAGMGRSMSGDGDAVIGVGAGGGIATGGIVGGAAMTSAVPHAPEQAANVVHKVGGDMIQLLNTLPVTKALVYRSVFGHVMS